MGSKDKLMTFRIPETLINEFKKFCELNSFSMSKRMRKLMENDLEKWKQYQVNKDKK